MESVDPLTSKINLRNLTLTCSLNSKKRSRDLQMRAVKSHSKGENEENVQDRLMCEENSLGRTVLNNSSPVLKDITNIRFLDEDGKGKNRIYRRKNEIARERWKILAKALLKPKKAAKDISVRRFTSFGLVTPNLIENLDKLQGCWLKYSTKIRDKTYGIEIYHLEQKLTPKELMGFNNTGNVCIWPSEEVLTFYLLSRIHWFEGKEILEVGGGMTAMAGLMLAKYSKAKKVDVTDGNMMSVKNLEKIIKQNHLDSMKTASFRLDWVDHERLSKKYDVVLSSDCLFFDETRSDLVETIWNSLKNDGLAVVVAPKRGNTLDAFVKMAAGKGFSCLVQTYYEDIVWSRHLKFKETCSEYNENIHYPILLMLTKSSQSVKFFSSLVLKDVCVTE